MFFMAWFEQYDFDEDPFTASGRVFGMDKIIDDLIYRVESGSMVFVEGKEGLGKSALLMKLVDFFGGKVKVFFFVCGHIERKVNIEKLMVGKYGFFGRIFGARPKNMMLFLDNASSLSKRNCERIKYYFDNNFIKSVVFTGVSYSRAHFSKSVRDRIGGRVIRLKELDDNQLVDLVKERAPGVDLFSDEIIKKVYKQSGNNTKKFLSHLSLLAEKAAGEGSSKVTENHLKEAFGDLNAGN